MNGQKQIWQRPLPLTFVSCSNLNALKTFVTPNHLPPLHLQTNIVPLASVLTNVKSISILFVFMSSSPKTFQKLESWLTIFFQVHQKDAARFSPFYGIIKCNVSINILQQHICSSLQTRIKNILGFCSEISKHYWDSYTFPFKNISKLGFLDSKLIIDWNKPNHTKKQRQNKGLSNVRKGWLCLGQLSLLPP